MANFTVKTKFDMQNKKSHYTQFKKSGFHIQHNKKYLLQCCFFLMLKNSWYYQLHSSGRTIILLLWSDDGNVPETNFLEQCYDSSQHI